MSTINRCTSSQPRGAYAASLPPLLPWTPVLCLSLRQTHSALTFNGTPPVPLPIKTATSSAAKETSETRLLFKTGSCSTARRSRRCPPGPRRRSRWCDAAAKRIVVDAEASGNARLRTLVHEVAHALGVGYAEYGRAR